MPAIGLQGSPLSLVVADREVGHVLQAFDQRRVVPVAAAQGNAGAEHLLGVGGVGQVDAQLLGALQGQVQVLLVQVDAEAWVEGALIMRSACTSRIFEEAKPPISASRTLAGSAPFLAANSRLRRRLDVQGDDDLVGDLGGLAVTVATDAGDVLAHGFEQRQGALEGFRAATDHNAQVPALAPTSPPDTGASR